MTSLELKSIFQSIKWRTSESLYGIFALGKLMNISTTRVYLKKGTAYAQLVRNFGRDKEKIDELIKMGFFEIKKIVDNDAAVPFNTDKMIETGLITETQSSKFQSMLKSEDPEMVDLVFIQLMDLYGKYKRTDSPNAQV